MDEQTLIWWGMGLFAAAGLLVVVELLIPTGGIVGLVASLTAIAGVVAFWQVNELLGIASLLGSIVLGVGAFFLAFRVLPNTPLGRGLVLMENEEDERRHEEALRAEREAAQALVGAEGVAMTDLRPVGSAEIEGARVEVLAQGGSLDAGTRVRVVSVEGNQVKVRPAG